MAIWFRAWPFRPLASGEFDELNRYTCFKFNAAMPRSPCNLVASEVKWCVTASTLESTSVEAFFRLAMLICLLDNQEDGAVYKANPGDKVTYHCKSGTHLCKAS